jgi:AcrR family transcriptional regulator
MDTLATPAVRTGSPDSPPKRASRPRGKEPVGRERILEAAGELFVLQGYAATTTRQISTKVGVKQPSLYYHFPNKAAMLRELLLNSARPSLLKARELLADNTSEPLARLLALIRFDVTLLTSGPSNVGALYLLPEITGPEFAEFRQVRAELIEAYGTLLSQTVAAGQADVASVPRTAGLLFSIVEGVILRRADNPNLSVEPTAAGIEEATLRILGATLPG